MRALILAAGRGTRLRPATDHLPKPLFPVAGRPLLDHHIERLAAAGCEAVTVNTHHLHHRIAAHVSSRRYPIPVHLIHEPRILGTGGAIRNAADHLGPDPFLVINADILTDIDLEAAYEAHRRLGAPVTLVLVDHPPVNTVGVTADGRVTGFRETKGEAVRYRTFTGISVLNPEVISYIPEGRYSESISAFEALIHDGGEIRAWEPVCDRWRDLGTPDRYRTAVLDEMAPPAFARRFPDMEIPEARTIRSVRLAGDGSNRGWFRLTAAGRTLVVADHGIRLVGPTETAEVDAYVNIGRHLHGRGLPVPEIVADDRFSGLVFMTDLGDEHLQRVIRAASDAGAVIGWYRKVIDNLADFAVRGADGFDPTWPHESPAYDRRLIIEREGRYFLEAFVAGYLGRRVVPADFEAELNHLADGALTHAAAGLMHRDLQSRNLMVQEGRPYFIDFGGARRGPVQYDLASLLIDPYVELPPAVRDRLLDYAVERIAPRMGADPDRFRAGYRYCAITRNLQILGAFGFLTRVRKKPGFADYIPAAVRTLRRNLAGIGRERFPRLSALADGL